MAEKVVVVTCPGGHVHSIQSWCKNPPRKCMIAWCGAPLGQGKKAS